MVAASDVEAAASQAWPPFALVVGLLLVGLAANAAGLFERAGLVLGRRKAPPTVLLLGSAGLVALVTATMNLDTAVVFLTPVLILLARRQGLREQPFLYTALFMANASSLFLPGANLTNLLVLGAEPVGSGGFAGAMFAPAAVAMLVTAAGLVVLLRPRAAETAHSATTTPSTIPAPVSTSARQTGRVAAVGVVVAGGLTILLRDPALPVLATGAVVAGIALRNRAVTATDVVRAVGPAVLLPLFALCVALGVLARTWDGPASLLEGAGALETAAVAALASVGLNNLPAAVLLSAQQADHPRALLIGLNLGPNLAVTGSLSSYLWYRTAKQVGAQPSALEVSRLGVVLAPAAIVAATLALSL